MIERLNKISSVILLTIIAECASKPLDIKNADGLNTEFLVAAESKQLTKRSPKPLGVGYVSYGLSPPDHEHHFSSDIASHGTLRKLVPSFPLQVQEAISLSAIKSEAIHRGPSVAHGAIINLVGHEIHQTHDPPKQQTDHVVVALNKEPSIIPHSIGVIQGLTRAVSKAKKTTITSKLSHLITIDDKMIPVITHSVSHIDDQISHDQDNFVPVVPVASHVIVTGHVGKPVLASTHNEHGAEGHDDHPVALAQRSNDDDDERNRFRDMVGGFGVGLSFGGQGAGHGFYAG